MLSSRVRRLLGAGPRGGLLAESGREPRGERAGGARDRRAAARAGAERVAAALRRRESGRVAAARHRVRACDHQPGVRRQRTRLASSRLTSQLSARLTLVSLRSMIASASASAVAERVGE